MQNLLDKSKKVLAGVLLLTLAVGIAFFGIRAAMRTQSLMVQQRQKVAYDAEGPHYARPSLPALPTALPHLAVLSQSAFIPVKITPTQSPPSQKPLPLPYNAFAKDWDQGHVTTSGFVENPILGRNPWPVNVSQVQFNALDPKGTLSKELRVEGNFQIYFRWLRKTPPPLKNYIVFVSRILDVRGSDNTQCRCSQEQTGQATKELDYSPSGERTEMTDDIMGATVQHDAQGYYLVVPIPKIKAQVSPQIFGEAWKGSVFTSVTYKSPLRKP